MCGVVVTALGSSGRVAGRGVCCLCTLWSTCVGVTLHGEAGEAGGVIVEHFRVCCVTFWFNFGIAVPVMVGGPH